MLTNISKPIFIHSLFRAGSTYLFEVFRRSGNKYWCYQEPENEILLHFVDDPSSLLDTTDSLNATLRHPKLDKPYLAEFVPVSSEIKAYFQKEFAYDAFFLPEDIDYPGLRHYLGMLIERAQGRPVLQFCRSTGRMKWMRRHFDAIHLFLWRHPWDQWWSYKVSSYFDIANQMILNAPLLPPVFQEIRRAVGLEEFHSLAVGDEIAHFDARSLSSAQSYLVFYTLWLHAMYEGFEAADAILSIDGLTRSAEYRRKILDELASLGMTGVDFSDCNVHQGWFGEKDAAFFHPIEQCVHEIFRHHGYGEETLRTITSMREEFDTGETPSPQGGSVSENSQAMKEDLERARQLTRQFESDASALKGVIVGLRSDVARLKIDEAKLQSIYNSLFWKTTTPLRETYWKIRSLYRTLNRRIRAPSQ